MEMPVADFFYTLVVYPLGTIVEVVFMFAQKTFRETGLSIIFVSAAISVLSLPLYNMAEHWQQIERGIQKKLQEKRKKINAVFSGDERYMILSTYYRQNHYHPIYALRSSLGLLIQIPFFIAAYSFLASNASLKGASFLFIPDLGAPDRLCVINNFRFNILPLIMTMINCIASFVYTRNFPLKEKLQLYAVAFLFLVLLYNSPSGLVIYWIGSNIFSLIKNIYNAIRNRRKGTVLCFMLSILCLMMIYYILVVHRGNLQVRQIAAFMLFFLGLLPWISPSLKKLFQKIFFVDYSPPKTVYSIWSFLFHIIYRKRLVSPVHAYCFFAP
jgi:YidC/Oxa1 family membrane protein insertase